MSFELKDNTENPQVPTGESAGAAIKALAEVTPPVPTTTTAVTSEDPISRKSFLRQSQSGPQTGFLDFANNTVIEPRVQPAVAKGDPTKVSGQDRGAVQEKVAGQDLSAQYQVSAVKLTGQENQRIIQQKLDITGTTSYTQPVTEQGPNYSAIKPVKVDYVDAAPQVKKELYQSYTGAEPSRAQVRYATDSAADAPSVVKPYTRTNVEPAGPNVMYPAGGDSYSRSDSTAAAYKKYEQINAYNAGENYSRNQELLARELGRESSVFRTEKINYEQPNVLRYAETSGVNRGTFDRDAVTYQRDLKAAFEKTNVDQLAYKIDPQKYNDTFTSYTGPKIPERSNYDLTGRLNDVHTMPGPGSDLNGRPPKEQGYLPVDQVRTQPLDGKIIPDQHHTQPVPDLNRLGENGKIPPGPTGQIDPNRLTDPNRITDTNRVTDPNRITDPNRPTEQNRSIPTEQHHGPEPTRPTSFERPVQVENPNNSPSPIKPNTTPAPTMTGPEGTHPVEPVRHRVDPEVRPQDITNKPQIENRRQENPTPEPVVRTNPVPAPQPVVEHRESPAPQVNPTVVRTEKREEEQLSRQKFAVGPGSSPNPESVNDLRLMQPQLVSRLNLDKTSAPGDLGVGQMPGKPVVFIDISRTEVKAAPAVDALNTRAALEGTITRTAALTAAGAVAAEGDRKAAANNQNQGDLSNTVKQGLTTRTGVDGVVGDQRTIKTDLPGTTGITVKTDVTGTVRVGPDGLPIKADLSNGPGRPGIDGGRDHGHAGAHGGKNGEGTIGHRVLGDANGVAGHRGIDGPNGRIPGKFIPGLDEADGLAGHVVRNGLISQVVPLTDRRILTGKLNIEETGEKDGILQSKDKLAGGAKRYMTGAEIALAAVIAAGGLRKLRGKIAKGKSAEEGSEEQEESLDYMELEDSATAEQWFSMNMMKKLGRISQGEMQKSRSDQVLKRPSYLVSKNDTLVSIAENLFEDPDLGWLIADVNVGGIKETVVNGKRVVELQDRQQIDLPVWQDIIDFYEIRPADAIAENLITVVTDSHMNNEMIDMMLNPVMGVASASADPFGRAPVVARQAAKPELAPAAPGLKMQQLGARLSHVAAALSPFSNQWPKPPATMGGELTVQERHA